MRNYEIVATFIVFCSNTRNHHSVPVDWRGEPVRLGDVDVLFDFLPSHVNVNACPSLHEDTIYLF